MVLQARDEREGILVLLPGATAAVPRERSLRTGAAIENRETTRAEQIL